MQAGRGGLARMTRIIGTIAATTIDGQGHRGCALRCHTPNRMQTNMMRIQRYIIQPPGSRFTKLHTIVPNHSWRIR